MVTILLRVIYLNLIRSVSIVKECDVIIHTAALVSNAMQDSDMWRVNVLATRNLIQAAKEHKVRRFVQISSIVAYGNSAEG